MARSAAGERRVVVGRIGGAHGVRGWVRAQSYTDPPEALFSYRPLQLRSAGLWQDCELEQAQLTQRGVLLKLAGVDTRDQAGRLNGTDLAVPRSVLPPVAAGQYYLSDLEGLEVRTPQGEVLGSLDHFLETPAHPVMVIRGQREHLVPLVAERLLEVDLVSGTMTVDWQAEW